MSDGTKIEWTDATANVINGCSLASPGCTNCYAMRLAGTRMKNHLTRQGLTAPSKAGPVWNGEVRFNKDALLQVMRWQRPRKIFWNAHGDMWHPKVPDEWIDRCIVAMALTPHHTHQVLTKRSDRMQAYFAALTEEAHRRVSDRITAAVNYVMLSSGRNWGKLGSTSTYITTIIAGTGAREPYMLRGTGDGGAERLIGWADGERWSRVSDQFAGRLPDWMKPTTEFGWNFKEWPLPNLWLGVSVEDNERRQRIIDLAQTAAAYRWISGEPILEAFSLTDIPIGEPDDLGTQWLFNALTGEQYFKGDDGYVYSGDGPVMKPLDWVVAGGESGPGSRKMPVEAPRLLRDQCAAADVPFLFKQWGQYLPAGQEMADGRVWNPHSDNSLHAVKSMTGRRLDGRTHDGYPA